MYVARGPSVSLTSRICERRNTTGTQFLCEFCEFQNEPTGLLFTPDFHCAVSLAGYRPRTAVFDAKARFRSWNRFFWLVERRFLTRQSSAGFKMIRLGELMMKTRKPAQAKRARKISDAIIAKSYLDLQTLRDEVRKAETSRGLSRKPARKTNLPKRRPH
jgi:hypothetical protein